MQSGEKLGEKKQILHKTNINSLTKELISFKFSHLYGGGKM